MLTDKHVILNIWETRVVCIRFWYIVMYFPAQSKVRLNVVWYAYNKSLYLSRLQAFALRVDKGIFSYEQSPKTTTVFQIKHNMKSNFMYRIDYSE